jgi:hypothetical protein
MIVITDLSNYWFNTQIYDRLLSSLATVDTPNTQIYDCLLSWLATVDTRYTQIYDRLLSWLATVDTPNTQIYDKYAWSSSWNIAESGVKHQKSKSNQICLIVYMAYHMSNCGNNSK